MIGMLPNWTDEEWKNNTLEALDFYTSHKPHPVPEVVFCRLVLPNGKTYRNRDSIFALMKALQERENRIYDFLVDAGYDVDALIAEQVRGGMSCRFLASTYQCGHQKISDIAKQQGIPITERRLRAKVSDATLISVYNAQNRSITKTAQLSGLHRNTVRRRLNALNEKI